jgi:hypothetical protein
MKVLLALLITLCLVGCYKSYPHQWIAAEKRCELNGGVEWIDIGKYTSIELIDVNCNDGAFFKAVKAPMGN